MGPSIYCLAIAPLAFISGLPFAHATLNPTHYTDKEIVTHVVPGRTPEICVLPTHFPSGDYSDKDTKTEVELCGYATQGNENPNVAVCPKLNSTNPGLDIHAIPQGYTLEQILAKNCEILVPDPNDPKKKTDLVKKLAKYKLSTSCSYSPAQLAYYHFSRILGGILNVPVAVIRTWDLQNHLAFGVEALKLDPNPSSTIHQTWDSLITHLRQGQSFPHYDLLFVDNFKQSYGSLIKNPTGEESYASDFFNGGGNDHTVRTTAFRDQNKIVAKLANAQDVATFVGRDLNAANLQLMVQIKDASEMIIMDTLLNQEDRMGNIHALDAFYYLDKSDLTSDGLPKLKSETKMTPAQITALGAIQVKQMILKDNDCGVARANIDNSVGLSKKIAHLDPETYKRLLQLNKTADQPEVVAFFNHELNFTAADLKSVRANLSNLAAQLHAGCVSGKIKLDLDLHAHFSGHPLTKVSCD